jgi:hypothetical protein
METSSVEKKSPIELLIEQLYKKGFLKEVDGNEPINLMNQAKEMEKQEIIKAAARGYLAMAEKFNLEDAKEYGKEYYDNCFGDKDII